MVSSSCTTSSGPFTCRNGTCEDTSALRSRPPQGRGSRRPHSPSRAREGSEQVPPWGRRRSPPARPTRSPRRRPAWTGTRRRRPRWCWAGRSAGRQRLQGQSAVRTGAGGAPGHVPYRQGHDPAPSRRCDEIRGTLAPKSPLTESPLFSWRVSQGLLRFPEGCSCSLPPHVPLDIESRNGLVWKGP